MPRIALAAVTVLAATLAGCSSTGSSSGRQVEYTDEGLPMPSKMRFDDDEVPLEIRAIEAQIDQESVILADEAEIHVSKNYEFDVSLTGDKVSSDLDKSGITERIALGKSTAFVRNLKLQCDNRIRVRIADFGTKPFIRITARGHCSHIVVDRSSGKHAVKRSDGINIRNDEATYLGSAPAAAPRPTSSR